MNFRWSFLDRFQDFGLLLLRVAVGAVFLFLHGLPRLGDPSSWARLGRSVGYLGIQFGHQVWGFAAVLAMTLGAVCLLLGWLHRPAALVLTITMGVASIWKFYPFGGWDAAAYPVSMAGVCLSLVVIGPGRFSLDNR